MAGGALLRLHTLVHMATCAEATKLAWACMWHASRHVLSMREDMLPAQDFAGAGIFSAAGTAAHQTGAGGISVLSWPANCR